MKVPVFGIIFLLIIVTIAFAAANKPLKGAHAENQMECVDCHSTEEPVKRASYKKCIECHGDMLDANKITFHNDGGEKFVENPHNTHAGPLRCTLCHSSHDESVVYCNTCHLTFNMKVP